MSHGRIIHRRRRINGRRRRSRIGVSLITLSPCFSFGFFDLLHWLARAFGFLLSRRYAFFTVAISLASYFRHDQVLRGLITVTVIPNAAKILARNLRIVSYLAVSRCEGRKNIPLPNASLVDRVVGREDV